MKKHTIFEFNLSRPERMRRNVRVDADDGLLAPVGNLARVGRAGEKLLAVARGAAGDVMISSTDTTVYATAMGGAGNAPVVVAEFDAVPSGAFNVGDGVMITFGRTGHQPELLRCDESATDMAPVKRVSRSVTPRVFRVDDGLITSLLPARQLKGSYTSRSTSLHPADAATVKSDFTEAYRSVVSQAASRHRFVQPVMVRVKACDSSGCAVYVSPPVILAPEGGVQCQTVEIPLSGDGLSSAGESLLRAVPFSIGVEFPAGLASAWAGKVTSVQVEVSPQIHAADFSGESEVEFNAASDPTSITLRVSAPGIPLTEGQVAADGTEFRRRVEGLLSHLDSVMITAFTTGVSGGELPPRTTGIYAALTADARTQVSRLIATVSSPDERCAGDDLVLLSMNYPHSFSAGCGCVSGDTVIWGNLASRLFDGYHASEYATAFSSETAGTTPVTAVVTLDDGSQLVVSDTLSGQVPSAFSPLLTYPHPRARQLSVMVGRKSFTIALRPTRDGRMAYALTADCRPMEAAVMLPMHIVPASDTVITDYPDCVAAAGSGAPLVLQSLSRCGQGEVSAVTPAPRGNSSLDFARRRFYAFTTRGICSLAAGSGLSTLVATMIDARPVFSAGAVCMIEGAVAAVAGNDLVTVKGNSVKTVMTDCRCNMLGWNVSQKELWCAGHTEGTIVANTTTDDFYIRDDVSPVGLLSDSGRLYVLSADGYVSDASDELAGKKRITMVFRASLARRSSVNGFCVRMFGESVDGTVTLTADNGVHSQLAYRLVEFRLLGSLDRPLESRVYAHPFRYVTLTINALVSTDTRLHRALFTAI